MSTSTPSRRSFLVLAGTLPLALKAAGSSGIPVGLEMYSVREQMKKDLLGTVRSVGHMGYGGVEFYAPYFNWTIDQTKEVRKTLDDVGLRCFSTHNGTSSFSEDGLKRAAELNQILGSKIIVYASAGRVGTLEGWKDVARILTQANDQLKPSGLRAGYHNHQDEFRVLEGRRPIEVIAENTPKRVVLQLDVGTCVEAGSDPVAWINSQPGRIVSLHCKDWSPEPGKGYRVLFGEGAVPWRQVFAAAEKSGGVEYYLVEQEGSDYSELETAERCLATFKRLRSSAA